MDDSNQAEPQAAANADELVFEDLEERYVQEGKWECGCTSTSDCCCCCWYVF